MHTSRTLLVTAALVAVSAMPLFGQGQQGRSGAPRESRRAAYGEQFEAQGLQVGESIDDAIVVYALDGEPTTVGELRNGGPTLLVTGSTTCPISQRNCPRLRFLSELGDDVGVFVVYTLEAHPAGDIDGVYPRGQQRSRSAPPRSTGTVRDVIGSEAQPETLEERLELAQEFQAQVVGDGARVIVDGMENELWTALGGGPNVAVLLDAEGAVVLKQGWLDVRELQGELE